MVSASHAIEVCHVSPAPDIPSLLNEGIVALPKYESTSNKAYFSLYLPYGPHWFGLIRIRWRLRSWASLLPYEPSTLPTTTILKSQDEYRYHFTFRPAISSSNGLSPLKPCSAPNFEMEYPAASQVSVGALTLSKQAFHSKNLQFCHPSAQWAATSAPS